MMNLTDKHKSDPKFVNPAANDFHLQLRSGAIDQGTNAGITTDFDYASRPYGAGYDLGAYEYGSQPRSPLPTTTPINNPPIPTSTPVAQPPPPLQTNCHTAGAIKITNLSGNDLDAIIPRGQDFYCHVTVDQTNPSTACGFSLNN